MTSYKGSIKLITGGKNSSEYFYPVTLAKSVFFSDGTSLENKSFSSGGSRLAGKKLYIIGDSITARNAYQQTLISEFGLASYNNGLSGNGIPISGNGMAKKFAGGAIMDTKCDICMMLLGTNDSHYAVTKGNDGTYNYLNLGTEDDEPSLYQTSFWAGVKYMLEKMINNFKGKPILVVAPPQRTDSVIDSKGVHANVYLGERVDILEKACRKYSVAFLDLYHNHTSQIILGDGVHPSTDGGMVEMGKIIGNKLSTLV